MSDDPPRRPSHAWFRTTRWSVVRGAGERDGGAGATRALAELCQIYWAPLYAYLRRTGSSPTDAEDLVQGFFEQLLARNDLQRVDACKGRFRSFLLVSLKHYAANQRDQQQAQKRGAGRPLLRLEFEVAERRMRHEPCHAETPEALFDRQWALTLLDRARDRLREEYAESGRDELFGHLEVYLTDTAIAPKHSETAAGLGMSEGAVKMAVSRLRQKFGERLRQEIAHTVASADDVEDEIRGLLAALASG